MTVIDFARSFRPKKVTPKLYFSCAFFLLFMSLDFFTTTWVAQGDISMEGNMIAAWWWKVTGLFHHIDIPIWIIYVLGIGWIANMKSEFLALWWLNCIAFGHVLGWLTWTPYHGVVDSMYGYVHALLRFDWTFSIPLGGFGIVFGGLFALLQTRLLPMVTTLMHKHTAKDFSLASKRDT